MHKFFLGIFIVVCTSFSSQAQNLQLVTPPARVDTPSVFQRMNLDVPAVLVVAGIAAYQFDKHFHGLKDFYFPFFKHSYDDYTQYLPAVVMLGMKTAGVKGRSSWKEMLVADAFSVAIMAATVNGLKHTIKKERPDKSARTSFPSGHTATAFMTATMLHKEYGHKSPWISVGAYSCATLTGLTRQLNNRHWMSDVIMGAGIGILSVELGYMLSDLIFRRKLKESMFFTPPNTKDSRPSFLGVQMGVKNHLKNYTLQDGQEMSIDFGSYVGLETAWYFNKNWGIGGQINISSHIYDVDGETQDVPFGMFSTTIGPYYSIPLNSCLRIENKFLIGGSWIQKNKFTEDHVDIKNNFNYTFGTAFSYWCKSNLSLKLFGEYKVMPRFVNTLTGRELSAGMSVNYMFGH